MWRQAHPGSVRRRRLALLAALAALVAVPASSSADLGDLIGKDTVRQGDSLVAVAMGRVVNPGQMSLAITTKPRGKKVQWSYTTDCAKDGEKPVRYPPPGQHVDSVDRSPIRASIRSAVPSPDSCSVAVSAKLDYKSGKKVTAKIFNK